MTNHKILILSLNGGSLELMNNLAQKGFVPEIKRITDEGNSGILNSVLPTLDLPAWASFHTGVNPCKHKVFSFFEIDKDGFPTQRLVSHKSLQYETLLEILSKHGKQIISLYIPLTYPSQFVNGCVVSGDNRRWNSNFTYPPKLGRKLKIQLGKFTSPKPRQFFPEEGFVDSFQIQRFLAKQIQSIQKTKELSSYLMEKFTWDIALIQFYAPDTVQHALWHYLDARHPGFIQDTKIVQMIGEFFKVLDDSIKELIQRSKPQATLIFSDHGYVPCTKILNLKKILQYEPKGIFVDYKVLYVDIRKTGYAYIKELVKKLESLHDPEKGSKVIRSAWRAEDLYQNCSYSNKVAVIILELESGYSCRAGSLGEPVFISCIPNKDYLSGTHTRKGFWIYSGNKAIQHQQNLSVDILDLPPTILRYFGIEIPRCMEGKILPIFS